MNANILFVDDNALLRRGFARLCRSLGDVTTVGSADEARALLERLGWDHFAVVVSDQCLPGNWSGVELLVHVRKHAPEVGRILITADEQRSRLFRSYEAWGVLNAYFAKPWAPASLRAAIAHAVDDSAPLVVHTNALSSLAPQPPYPEAIRSSVGEDQ